jgi:superfamily I DNA/RNA helicase
MPDFVFRLPLDNQLTDTQRIALDYDSSLVVSGGPGSGKTVVTINRFLIPVRNGQSVMFFTYNKTLLASIKGVLRAKSEEVFGELEEVNINWVIGNSIASFSKYYKGINYDNESAVENTFRIKTLGGKYKEVFFDEAQDLTPAVFAKAFMLAEKITCGADNAQNLQGNFPPDEAVEIILEKLNAQQSTDWQELEANFRNTLEIFEFARSFVPENEAVQNIDTSELRNGEKPEVLSSLNDDAQMVTILEIIQNNPTSNIGILVNFKRQIDKIKGFLENNSYSCKANAPDNLSFSYYYSGMPLEDENIVLNKMKTPFIVTYDSCKGLEFDIVIMPFFDEAAEALTQSRKKKVDEQWIVETNYDGTPKMWATPNHYYVGATRARSFLYLLCNSRPSILSFFESIRPRPIQIEPQASDDLPF